MGPGCPDRRAGCEAPVSIAKPGPHLRASNVTIQGPDRSLGAAALEREQALPAIPQRSKWLRRAAAPEKTLCPQFLALKA